MDSVGGQAERGWESATAPTLKATHYKCPPRIAQAAGFCTEHSAQARGVDYQEECAPTLRAGVTPAVMYKPTAYSFDSLASNSMKSANPHSGCREVEVRKTLDTSHPDPSKNQGGIAVLQPVVYDGANVTSPVNASNPHPGDPCHTLSTDSRNLLVECYYARGNGDGKVVNTLTGDHNNRVPDYSSVVCYPIHDQATSFSGKHGDKSDGKGNGLGVGQEGDPMNTLTGGDRHAVAFTDESSYIVRRLTPTECARLQGFADQWGHIEPKETFTDEEYRFWLEVRNTHAAINGKKVQEYTKPQMLTWYNKLHTDSAEYRMWGNGIALPPALYVMQGIIDALEKPTDEGEDEWML